MKTRTNKLAATAAVAALALGAAGPAYAVSNQDGYSDDNSALLGGVQDQGGPGNKAGTGPETQAGGQAPSSTVNASNGQGSLPFTGVDLALIAGAGGLLLGAGLGMRRVTRAPHSA